MRFLVSVASDWTVILTSPDTSGWSLTRTLARAAAGPDGGAFPLPPAAERPPPPAPHAELCAGDARVLREHHEAITTRRAAGGAVERFGRYLFATLIGDAAWREIVALAGNSIVELALAWDAGDQNLHRLNWELMCGPDGFLARGIPRPVVVTRLVAGAGTPAQALHVPARVLFLVGTSLSDSRIQAGAEFLGILRRIEGDGRSTHSRIVERASTEQALRAVRSFRPDVVHVVCHGDFDRGRPYLEFELNEGESDPAEGHVFADRLLGVLTAEGELPPPRIVVLAACNTGGAEAGRVMGAHDTAPLAAQLVSGGVPVVVGMAGRISDRACRHFTRRFGQLLVRGGKLVDAVEQGRRAAFASGPPPDTSVDWAFPAVFLSAAVEEGYRPTPIRLGDPDTSRELESRIRQYGGDTEPVFCGRHQLIDSYYHLFDSADNPVLAVYSNAAHLKDIGRSRLLAELIGQAIRDGHVPCLVRKRDPDEPLHFVNTTAFGLKVLEAIAHARTVFALSPPRDSVLLALCSSLDEAAFTQFEHTIRNLPTDLAFSRLLSFCQKRAEEWELDGGAVRKALQADLLALGEEARQRHPYVREARGRAVVMFDDVHEYDKALPVLFNEVLDSSGLGLPHERVPAVLVFALGTPADEHLLRLAVQNSKSWLTVKPLEPFSEGEDILACERVLLHPFLSTLKPLAVNEGVSDQQRTRWERTFRLIVKGLPVRFRSDEFHGMAEIARDDGYLVEADDERLLREMISAEGR